jgi:hypothetical protein
LDCGAFPPLFSDAQAARRVEIGKALQLKMSFLWTIAVTDESTAQVRGHWFVLFSIMVVLPDFARLRIFADLSRGPSEPDASATVWAIRVAHAPGSK